MKNILAVLLILITNSFSFSQSIEIGDGAEINIGDGTDICAQNGTITGNLTGNGTQCDSPLPVTLSYFSFTVVKNNVGLSWTTLSETNNSGFDIERKMESGNWQKIGFVNGNGTTNEQRKYTFEDKKLKTGNYTYRIKQNDYNGNFEYFQLRSDVKIDALEKFTLSQNYPNPFNPSTKIDFELPVNGKVTIKVYDIMGREVGTFVNEFKDAGYHTIVFDGSNLSSGIYFYTLSSINIRETKRMLLIK